MFQVYNRVSWLNALSKVMKTPLEHEDAPVLKRYSIGELRALIVRADARLQLRVWRSEDGWVCLAGTRTRMAH